MKTREFHILNTKANLQLRMYFNTASHVFQNGR